MIHSVYYPKEGPLQESLSFQQMQTAISDENGLLWVNLSNPTEEERNSILTDLFAFHPLTIDDCVSIGYQPPKVDDFGQYLFLIMHVVQPNHDFREMETRELSFFLGSNYLVSYHQEENPCTYRTCSLPIKTERKDSSFRC